MSLFNLGLSGLLASQSALRTTGHNISNANTPGFHRQRVSLSARPPVGAGNGFRGTGVDVDSVRRELDTFVQSELRTSTSSVNDVTVFHDLAGRVDNILADPNGGLAPALTDFFDAMHSLASDPASIPARQVLQSSSQGLVQRFKTLETRFSEIRSSLNDRIRADLSEISSLSANLAKLNGQVVRQQNAFSGQPPNDLLDKRDELVRQLAEKIDIRTFVQTDGSLSITAGSGQALVVGQQAGKLTATPSQFDPSALDVSYSIGGSSSLVTSLVSGGALAGALRFGTEVLDVAERNLGQVAIGLTRALNEQHRAGQTLDGTSGGDLFSALDQSAPAVFARSGNTGSPPAQIAVSIPDVSALTASDYLLARSGAVHRLTRLSDGKVFTLGTFPGGAEVVDGLRLALSSGTIASGDQFLIQPTRNAVDGMALVPKRPEELAAVAPVRAAAQSANLGNAVVTQPRVNLPSDSLSVTFNTPPSTFDVKDITTGANLATNVSYTPGASFSFNGVTTSISGAPSAGDAFTIANTVGAAQSTNTGTGTIALPAVVAVDPALTNTVTITFTSATTFDVTGAAAGAPVTNVSYTSGAPISFNGWTLAISGTPRSGDVFTVGANTNGVGDNRNALALADLQTRTIMQGGASTFEEVYGQLVSKVGTVTRQAEVDQSARDALHTQLTGERESLSGVNLDEEAANLMRFQQAFQANSQLIAAANRIFDSLLRAVG